MLVPQRTPMADRFYERRLERLARERRAGRLFILAVGGLSLLACLVLALLGAPG
jgi:hypothetical protein